MIRTISVALTNLPSAIAYRRKASAGGSAIVIVRADATQPGIASISKTSGEPIISKNTPAELFSADAFQEAMQLTAGLPYRKMGAPAAPKAPVEIAEEEIIDDDDAVAEKEVEVVVDSDEYQKLVDAYTNKKGVLSYDLMNKEMIQLAHKSEVVQKMLAEGASEQEIVDYVVGVKFRNATGNKNLTDEQVAAMADLIDEVSPKGAFKELRAKIRSMQAEAKRA